MTNVAPAFGGSTTSNRKAWGPGYGGREICPGKSNVHPSQMATGKPLAERPQDTTAALRTNAQPLNYWSNPPRNTADVAAREIQILQQIYKSKNPAGAVAGDLPGGENQRRILNKTLSTAESVVIGEEPARPEPDRANIHVNEEREKPKQRGIVGWTGFKPRQASPSRPGTAASSGVRALDRPQSPPSSDFGRHDSFHNSSNKKKAPSFSGDVVFIENGRPVATRPDATTTTATAAAVPRSSSSHNAAAPVSTMRGNYRFAEAIEPKHMPPRAKPPTDPRSMPLNREAKIAAKRDADQYRVLVEQLTARQARGQVDRPRSALLEKAARRTSIADKINYPRNVPMDVLVPYHQLRTERVVSMEWAPMMRPHTANGAARNYSTRGAPYGTTE